MEPLLATIDVASGAEGACAKGQNSFTLNSRSQLSMSLDGEGSSDVSGPKLMLQAATPDASLLRTLSSNAITAGKLNGVSFGGLGQLPENGCVESENSSEEFEQFSVFSSVSSADRRSSGDITTEPEIDEFVSVEQRTARILTAVEFYFSDEHVAKDAFMYRHIMRGKGGFVNMKLVASFRKVKNITKDWTVVRDAVKSSGILQLNAEGTKVKRVVAFSPSINPLAKCVLVYNLGAKPSMGIVEQHLERYGRICKISIYFPGQAVPNEVRAQRSRLDIGAAESLAVVEFSTAEEARQIIAEIRVRPPSPLGIQVALLDLKGSGGGSGSGGGGPFAQRQDSRSGSDNDQLALRRAGDSRSGSDNDQHEGGGGKVSGCGGGGCFQGCMACDGTVGTEPSSISSDKATGSISSDKATGQTSPSPSSRRRKKKTRLQHLSRDDNSGTSDTGSESGYANGSGSGVKMHRIRAGADAGVGGANSASWRKANTDSPPLQSPKSKSPSPSVGAPSSNELAPTFGSWPCPQLIKQGNGTSNGASNGASNGVSNGASNAAISRRHWLHSNSSSSSMSFDGIVRHPHGPSENGFVVRRQPLDQVS